MRTWLYNEYLTLWDCERLDFWKAYFPFVLNPDIMDEHLNMIQAYPWLTSRVYGRVTS